LEAICHAEGCHVRAEYALAITFQMPGDEVPSTTCYFSFPVCAFHCWPDEAVLQFITDNWEELCKGFGLGLLPQNAVIFDWVPWYRAVEFWRKIQTAKKETIH